ncbi:MAG: YslB family protein [Kurthia sp.]|nr:YslB family protein [Candidatus Kurthia equi]
MNSMEMKHVTAFGYELIRDHILSAIVGKNEEDILYWCGKEIARKFPLLELEEVTAFFEEASWGTLELTKTSKAEAIYTLTGDPDIIKFDQRCFRLESGFLAEQNQKYNGYLTECYEIVDTKKNVVQFQVKWDLKDPIHQD